MKIKLGNALVPVNILMALLIIVIRWLPYEPARIILGIPFVLFFPGYVLTIALFPSKVTVNAIERTALSFGLSIAIVGLLLLVLNYMPWGITQKTITLTIAFTTLALSVFGWFRERTVPANDRVNIQVSFRIPGFGATRFEKILSVVLIFVIVVTIGFSGYTIANIGADRDYTEFYLPEAEVEAGGVSTILRVEEETRVTAGIVNHEGQTETYRIKVTINGTEVASPEPIRLSDEEKWEGIIAFKSPFSGRVKVEFYLFKGDDTVPYMDPLRLYMEFVR